MKREIKFRVFDESENDMVSWEQIQGGLIDIGYIFEDIDWLKWMQYTGLKDKNGKEIYEGDIVSFPCGTSTAVNIEHNGEKLTAYRKNPNNKGVVIWHNGGFDVHNEPKKTNEISGIGYYGSLGKTGGLRYTFEIEVIGNIYENPELLTT